MDDETPQLLQHTIEHAESSTQGPRRTIVLLHGFPDGPALWSPTSAHLTERGYRVIRLALPGFEDGATSAPRSTFEETIDRLHATLVHTKAVGATLVGHDWGAIFLYLLLRKHPEDAGRLVTIEIGAAPRTLLATVGVLLYQSALNLAHALGPGVGDWCMNALCRLAPRRPDYPGRPTPRAHHGWLYRQAWREAGSEGPWPLYFRNAIAKWTPPPSLPFLFVYGDKGLGPLRFHSAPWREAITSHCPDSGLAMIPGGHWCHLEDPDAFHGALDAFLDPTGPARRSTPSPPSPEALQAHGPS